MGKAKGTPLFNKHSKCEFHLEEVKFLGHVMSKEGVTVDLSKIKEVVNWQRLAMRLGVS